MSESKLNISKHTNALMRQLGLEPPNVRSIHITPTELVAEIYLTNEDGQKYIENSVPATGTLTFPVRT